MIHKKKIQRWFDKRLKPVYKQQFIKPISLDFLPSKDIICIYHESKTIARLTPKENKKANRL